jgi:hypothetical protein
MGEIYIDRKLTTGLTYEATSGTVTVSNEDLVTFNALTGTLRRTRWFEVYPGDTVTASVQMKGANSTLRLYTSDAYNSEDIVSYVESDSVSDLKTYSVSYTLPVNSSAKLVGIGFLVTNGVGLFYNPKISIQQSRQTPNLIACGLVNMVTGEVSPNFPSFGISSTTLTSNKMVVQLDQLFKGTTVRPLAYGIDGTPSVFQHAYKLVCSDITYTNGIVTFYLYYVNSSGVVVAPPANTSAQFLVYY